MSDWWPSTNRAPMRDVLANRQVQLIAAAVVLTVFVKQLVDYQFNAATATLGSREAIAAFQGKFNAATQWLPLVAAAAIRPALGRWGVGAALLMLPSSMIVVNLLLGLRGGLGPAAIAKGTETTLRYSAERTGREILYLPVSDAIRARAKPMIDVGLESGLAKALSAGLIFVLLQTIGASRLAWPAVALSILWLVAAVAERRAYVRALKHAIRTPDQSRVCWRSRSATAAMQTAGGNLPDPTASQECRLSFRRCGIRPMTSARESARRGRCASTAARRPPLRFSASRPTVRSSSSCGPPRSMRCVAFATRIRQPRWSRTRCAMSWPSISARPIGMRRPGQRCATARMTSATACSDSPSSRRGRRGRPPCSTGSRSSTTPGSSRDAIGPSPGAMSAAAPRRSS